MSEHEERIKVIPIQVPGQYGLNYSAERNIEGADAGLEMDETDWVIEQQALPPKFFLKSPDPKAKESQREDFMREFESGYAINSAAEHLKNNPVAVRREWERATNRLFNIPRMIGRGRLFLPEQDGVDCLIYEFADASMLHQQTFPKTEEADVSVNLLGFAHSLARAVQVLHNQGVVHSFLVPRNILRQSERSFDFSGVFNVVGFGYAQLCDARAKVPHGIEVSEQDDCFRAPETRNPETYKAYWLPADIYSIGALLHYLLLRMGGKGGRAARESLNKLPIDVRRLKEHIADDLRAVVPSTVRGNENILKIIDSCVRNDQDQRFSCIEELLDAIDIAETAGRGPRFGVVRTEDQQAGKGERKEKRPETECKNELEVAEHVRRIVIKPKENQPTQLSYFGHLRETLATELAQKFGNLNRGHLEIYGSRDRIIPSLCRLLGSAQPEDMYETLTLPDYWTDENLGSMGRFLTMNKHMVRRGVDIRRVFLVSKSFHELTEVEQVILDAQLAAWEEIEGERASQEASGYGNFAIYVHRVEEEQIAEFENIGSTVAYLGPRKALGKADTMRNVRSDARPDEKQTVCLNFFSTARAKWNKGRVHVTRSIKKVRYWTPTAAEYRFRANVDKFNAHVADGESLLNYARGDYRGKVSSVQLESLLSQEVRGIGDGR